MVAAVLCLVLALVTGGLAVRQYATGHGARAVVLRYFAAVSQGDAPAALALADQLPANAAYLTSQVLRQQLGVAKLTDVAVSDVQTSGPTPRVAVSYRLSFAAGAETVRDSVAVVRHGTTWRLASVAASADIVVSGLGAERLVFAGRPLPSVRITLFPGALPLSTDTPAATVHGRPYLTLSAGTAADPASAAGGSPNVVTVSVDVSKRAKMQVSDGISDALAACLAAASVDPACPLPPSVGRPVPGSLHGALSQPLASSETTVAFAASGRGILEVSAGVEVKGTWQAWNFENQAVPQHGTIVLKLSLRATVDNPGHTVWAAAT
ncbi:MAG: serine/threonine-protein kinase [Frankiales bacterium]|nr:serine/threonine-protein kinase [Frankiales bacterium]